VNGSTPAAGTPVKKMTIKTLSVGDQLAQASPEVSPSVSPSS
jgi:hypothetical protein